MVVTSQNIIFCSCSHYSRTSSILSLRCSSIISFSHLLSSSYVPRSSLPINFASYPCSRHLLHSFSASLWIAFYPEVGLSWQKGLKRSLGLGRLTHCSLVQFLPKGWALWTWPASCWLQVLIRTSECASTWANTVRIDNFCRSLFWHTLCGLPAAVAKIKWMIRYIGRERYGMNQVQDHLHALGMECRLDDNARPPRSSLGISYTPLIWSQSDARVN